MLHVVPTEGQETGPPAYESVLALATRAVPPGIPAEQMFADARNLADQTVKLIQADQNPAILASVALVITDPPMRVAFLEVIGDYLC